MRAILIMVFLFAVTGEAGIAANSEQAGIDPAPGARIPLDLKFRDASGDPVTLREITAGKPFLLVPMPYRCGGTCDGTLAGAAAAVRGLPRSVRDDVTLVALGIDPDARPADAASAIETIHARFPDLKRVHALTGDRADVALLTDALGYHTARDSATGRLDYVAATAVVTGDGYLSRWLYGSSPASSELGLALDEASSGQIGTLSDKMMLMCYHYDPSKGCYLLFVPGLLRLGWARRSCCWPDLSDRHCVTRPSDSRKLRIAAGTRSKPSCFVPRV